MIIPSIYDLTLIMVSCSQITDHFSACAAGATWKLLDRHALDKVTRHLASRHDRLLRLIDEVAGLRAAPCDDHMAQQSESEEED
jgi:hypothetical protein